MTALADPSNSSDHDGKLKLSSAGNPVKGVFMKKRVRVCVGLGAALLAGTVCTATEVFPPPLAYNSPDTPLAYRYSVRRDEPPSIVRSVSIPTSFGELRGTIQYTPALTMASTALWVNGATPTVTTTITPDLDPRYYTWVFNFGSFGSMFYTIDPAARTLLSLGSTVSDCEGLGQTSVMMALTEASRLIGSDVSAKATVPIHETMVAEFLWTNWMMPRLIDDCRAALIRPQICQTSPDFPTCQNCCDENTITDVACKIGLTICLPLAEAPPCWAGGAACIWGENRLRKIEIEKCTEYSCTGKPGDPTCASPPTCQAAGGTCVAICMGRSLCGSCEHGWAPTCCK